MNSVKLAGSRSLSTGKMTWEGQVTCLKSGRKPLAPLHPLVSLALTLGGVQPKLSHRSPEGWWP